jgi:hypothetical protein
MDDAGLNIVWPESREKWNLPLQAANQTGMSTPKDGLADLVSARKIG